MRTIQLGNNLYGSRHVLLQRLVQLRNIIADYN